MLSSAAVYGNPGSLPVSEEQDPNPISAYGFHKWQSEILCREFSAVYHIRTATARLFSAYGPGLRRQVMWDIINKALTQPEVVLQGDGSESRDFTHALDIASGIERILLKGKLAGEVYNVASGKETTIAELSEMIFRHLPAKPPVRYTGSLPAGTPKNWRAEISKICALGFSPQIGIENGVAGFCEWCLKEIKGF
jgi:UDP-glucose 4-epimerase